MYINEDRHVLLFLFLLSFTFCRLSSFLKCYALRTYFVTLSFPFGLPPLEIILLSVIIYFLWKSIRTSIKNTFYRRKQNRTVQIIFLSSYTRFLSLFFFDSIYFPFGSFILTFLQQFFPCSRFYP